MEDAEIKKIRRQIDRALDSKEFREAKEQYINLAAYLTRCEDNEGGLDAYKEALLICQREGWELDEAIAQRMMAETYCSLGEYEEAVKYAKLYLNYSKKAKNDIEEQRGYATKGRIYFCWAEFLINEKTKNIKKVNGLLNESLYAYEESLKICLEKLNDIDSREKDEMKSRLFQNLGLVMGSLGNYKEANAKFALAIQINKRQNFKENLYWCYFNQSEYFYRASEFLNACTYCDLAVKTASSKEEECDALKLKARAFLKMGDILKAKGILREVYKRQQGRDREVKEHLRIIVFLCKLEDRILATSNTNYKEKKNLYEKKGDAYCALKQYCHGVDAYLKMLDFAMKMCKEEKELLPCYTSLAQTYKDDGQYSPAMFYCQKELELIDEQSAEGCKAYLFLAELYEYLNYEYDTVYNTYQKALRIAQEIGDRNQEVVVLSTLIQMQSDFGYFSQAEENERVLSNLKREFHEFSGDIDADVNTENFSCDVADDELLSDVEDIKQRHCTRREFYKIKRNQKGETELHVAAIKGDVNKVKQLIEKGHPINERDLAGWSVIHEACNHGHVAIVNILLDNGANINDPGGEECDGITPLHDAAENGHIDVIKLLLSRGACKAVITNLGDTPLDCLKRWRTRTTLDPGEITEYEEACKMLKSNLDSATTKEERDRLVTVPRANETLRKELCETIIQRSKEKSSATALYRSAIDGIRRRHAEMSGQKATKKAKPALISEDEIVEDWLEEDMEIREQSTKRRKVQKTSPKSCSVYRPSEDLNVEETFEVMDISDRSDASSERSRSASPVFNVKKKQSNFLSEEPERLSTTAPHQPVVEIVKPTTECEQFSERSQNFHTFRIPLENEIILIPILQSEIKKLTIRWLISSVVERYKEIHGTIPDILMMTGDNAVLKWNDPLDILINEEIKTRVLGFKSMTLGEMYTQLVDRTPQKEFDFSVYPKESKPYEEVARALNLFATTGDLLLRDKQLRLQHFLPAVEILRKEKRDVRILDVSRNHLGDEAIDSLMNYMEMQSIERLYLKGSGITIRGVQHFATRMQMIPEKNLSRMKELDFSFNILRDESLEYLNLIMGKLENLEYFGTEFCKLSKPLMGRPYSSRAQPVDSNGPVAGL